MNSRSIGSASKLLIALLILAGLGGPAWGRKRVAVAPFSGRGADELYDEVAEIVQEDSTVVSQGAFRRSVRRLRVRRLTDTNVARIAADLQVDVVIEGEYRRRHGSRLELTVRDGATGAVADRFTVRLRGPRLDDESRTELEGKLLPALAKAGGLASDEPIEITPPAPATAPAAPRAGEDVDTEQPLAAVQPPAAAAEPTEPAPGAAAAEETGRDVELMSSQRYARHAAIDIEVGMAAALRNLRFTYRPDLDPTQRPNGYKGALVPALLVNGELYPLELMRRPSAVSGLGVSFVFDRVLLIKSKLAMNEYATTQMRYGAGLRYRYAFGRKPTLPTLKLIAGWNHLGFTINRGGADLDLPNVSYSFLDLGAAGRFPLGTAKAALYVDARYLLVLGAGEISQQSFYGKGSILGVDANIGVELLFARRAILRVGARYQRLAFDFNGTGNLANNRDMDPSTQDVGGALDQYFSGYVTGGYLF